MNTQTAYLAAALAMGIASVACILGSWLAARIRRHRHVIAAKRLHDCKPGCFMANKRWEDTV